MRKCFCSSWENCVSSWSKVRGIVSGVDGYEERGQLIWNSRIMKWIFRFFGDVLRKLMWKFQKHWDIGSKTWLLDDFMVFQLINYIVQSFWNLQKMFIKFYYGFRWLGIVILCFFQVFWTLWKIFKIYQYDFICCNGSKLTWHSGIFSQIVIFYANPNSMRFPSVLEPPAKC